MTLDPEWCAWFAGFCDGEACFRIMDSTPYVAIMLRQDDHEVLEEIQGVLGGTILSVNRRASRASGCGAQDQVRWQVCGRDSAPIVVEAVKLGAAQGSWESWFAGFCDGEASFQITTTGSVLAVIDLRKDDESVLREVQTRLGGSLRMQDMSARRAKGQFVHDSIRWRASTRNAPSVVEALEGRMRSKKKKDFELWAEAVRFTTSLPARHPDRRPKMLEYKAKIEAVRREGLVPLEETA